MLIQFLGGANEIGASCIYIEMESLRGKAVRILLDCGIRPKCIGDHRLPRFELLESYRNIHALLLSHAHLDHTGAVPCVAGHFPEMPIYCTRPTRDIMDVLLRDSARLMTMDTSAKPLYSDIDVEYTMNQITAIEFNTPIHIAPGIRARFIPAGHILGASSILIESPESRILYTGDFTTQSLKTVGSQKFTGIAVRPDILITEGTYGNTIHPPGEAELARLTAAIIETTAQGGRVLISVFSVGRSQELLLMLVQQKLDIPVYVDGMIQTINLIYEINRSHLPRWLQAKAARNGTIFTSANLYQVYSKEHRYSIIGSREPSIILSSGGMLSGGTSSQYAGSILEDEKSMIALVGYQDSDTPGGKLIELISGKADNNAKTLEVNNSLYSLRCRVEKFDFSAHADMNGILLVVKKVAAKDIILVHGEAPALKNLGSVLTTNGFNVHIPGIGDMYEILDKQLKKQDCSEMAI